MFIGHKSDLKNGEIKSLDILSNKKVLVNDNEVYKIFSNICPHQNSYIVSGIKNEFRCQYHGWSWNLDGTPKDSGASQFCNDVKLTARTAFQYEGMLFENKFDTEIFPKLNFENLVLDEYRIDNVEADPKISMDIFLDVDHIPIVHNGVYDLLGIEGKADVKWKYADWGSIQTVTDSNDTVVAVWIAIYPYTMIEWQSGSLFVTRAFDNKMAVWKYKDSTDIEENYRNNSKMWEAAFAQDKNQAVNTFRFPQTGYLEEAKLHYRNWLEINGSTT